MTIVDEEAIEWRDVVGYPDYEVSNYGVVRRKTAHHRCPKAYPAGYEVPQSFHCAKEKSRGGKRPNAAYKCVYLYSPETGTSGLFVHVVVATAFHGPKPSSGYQAAHGNGIKTDNRASNLRWATPAENQADRIAHGTSNRGERHGRSVLTETQVITIRERLAKGELPKDIAEEFGVTRFPIYAIRDRITWRHI